MGLETTQRRFLKRRLKESGLAARNYLHSDPLTAMHDTMCAIRARANRELMAALSRRETANAAHFERLCAEHEALPFTSAAGDSPEPPPAQ